jgi:hypothetical protein
MNETTPSPLGNVVTIDDERIKNHLDRVVRGSVEETLNALLDAEADRGHRTGPTSAACFRLWQCCHHGAHGLPQREITITRGYFPISFN